MFHIKLFVGVVLTLILSFSVVANEVVIPTHVPAIKVATGEPGKNVGPGIFLEEGAGLSFDISVFSMGHEVGNGGFAFDKSIIVLQAAADELIEQIEQTDYPMFDEFPERREILLEVLPFERLEQYLLLSAHNNGNPLWLGYDINPRKVMVFQLFYMAFWRYKDKDFTETVQEIKQLLLHEASHIWGFNQDQAREFSQDLLNYLDNPVPDFVKTSDQVFIQHGDYCSCLRGESIDEAAPQCAAQCAGTDTSEPTLYVHATTSPEVYLHPEVGTLRNWCTKELGGVQANCRLEAVDDMANVFPLPITFLGGDNFSAPIASLTPNKRYVLRLVETVSEARSNAFQVKWLLPGSTPEPTPGYDETLRIMNVSQYACLNRAGEYSGGYYDWLNLGVRSHYYFPQNRRPQSMPASEEPSFLCHDPLFGDIVYPVSPRFEELSGNFGGYFGIADASGPRFEEISGYFGLWDASDPRFYDLDNDGHLDINNMIHDQLFLHGVPPEHYETPVFSRLDWFHEPTNPVRTLGFFMRSFPNPDGSFRAYCPTRYDYGFISPETMIFIIIGRLIGNIDTELIYLGERESLSVLGSDGSSVQAPDDVMLIRHSLLKLIGFYHENGQNYAVDEYSMWRETVKFYWPADPNDPYVKKANQRTYTISVSPESFDGSLGCVPIVPLNLEDFTHSH